MTDTLPNRSSQHRHPYGNITVSAVMPCLNEEQTLGTCIQKAQRCFKELGIEGEVVIADNGSTDQSIEIALSLGAVIVKQPIKGYGAAITKGIEQAKGQCVIIGDSDDSYEWSNLAPFIQKIEEGYDLVIGNRFKGGIAPGAMPFLHKYLGNPVLSLIAKIIYRAPIGDFHCGLRALNKNTFSDLKLSTTGMEFATEMIANASIQGMKITEVPTTLQPDGRNRPPHLRSFRDGWRHLKFIFTHAPEYLYLLPAIVMFVPGMGLMLSLAKGPIDSPNLYLGIHFLALGSLLSLAGMNIFYFGLLAKIILKIRLPRYHSILIDIAQKHVTLERSLIVSSMMILGGLAFDFFILVTWLANGRNSMEDTVHAVFVATTLIIMGLSAFLSSFLINMITQKID